MRINNIICLIIFLALPVAAAQAYMLPDTGQTTCYDAAGTTIVCPLPGQPLAQDGTYTIQALSYTDNGNGTVTDNNTGLIWQKEDDGIPRSWSGAASYCSTLPLAPPLVWRLPNRRELVGIVDYGIASPGPAIHLAFTGTKSNYYWSNTAFGPNTANAWEVNFDNGEVVYSDKALGRYARCVSGVELQGSNLTLTPAPITIIDSTTGLIFAGGDATASWEAALNYCETLSHAGKTDWRLPSIKEIEAYLPLTGTSLSEPAFILSSTTYAANPVKAWIVSNYDFSVQFVTKATATPVTFCVRAGYPGMVELTVTKSGTGSGTVTSGPAWIDCGAECSGFYETDATVKLSAIPDIGPVIVGPYVFRGWSGNADCADGQLIMDMDKACTATFDTCANWYRARVSAGSYDSIDQAVFWALGGEAVQIRASNRVENVTLADSKDVTLQGGYNCNFFRVSAAHAVITGVVTIQSGTMTFDGIIIM